MIEANAFWIDLFISSITVDDSYKESKGHLPTKGGGKERRSLKSCQDSVRSTLALRVGEIMFRCLSTWCVFLVIDVALVSVVASFFPPLFSSFVWCVSI